MMKLVHCPRGQSGPQLAAWSGRQ